MAMYRKLGKASAQRNALLRNQVTQLLYTMVKIRDNRG